MIKIRCPYCKVMLDIKDELAGTVYRCPDCQKTMTVPALKAPAAPAPTLPAAKQTAPAPAPVKKEPRKPPTFDEFWAKSAAVDEERTNLENLNVKLADRELMPLPALSPKLAEKLGEPIASLRGVPKITRLRIGMCLFLVAAGFIAMSTAITLAIIGDVVIGPGRVTHYRNLAGLVGVGAVFAFGSSAIPFLRGSSNSLKANFWICENGVVWERGGITNALPFDKIGEIYQDRNFIRNADRAGNVWITAVPVIRMMLDEERVTFYATANVETAEFIAYLEHKATAVFFRNSLRKVYENGSVSFGALDIDRLGLHFKGDVFAWPDLKRVEVQDSPYALILVRRRKSEYAINAHNVSMARVAASIAGVIIEEELDVDEGVVVKREVKDPFAF